MRARLALAVLVLGGCGSRTALPGDDGAPGADLPDATATARDAGVIDARSAVDAPSAIDGPIDAPSRGPCTRDGECDDGVACTQDRCELAKQACVHVPDDALCPISHGCDPALGCQARALAQTASELYEVKLPSGALRLIGPTMRSLTDIALHPNGTLYGVDFGALVAVDSNNAMTTFVAGTTQSFNALDAAPDGTLYGGAGSTVFVLDVVTGGAKTFGTFPGPLQSSGDLAFLGARLVATARGGGAANDLLVEFDRKTGVSFIVGSVGFPCVWGLAAYGPTLYGLTCEGKVLTIDGATGAATQVAQSPLMFYGATAR